MKKSNKKGFTIVELVIVIAVIAILAAVLIPTFSNVIDNAKKSAALQGARNALTEYMMDHAKDDTNVILYIVSGDYTYKVTAGKLEAEPVTVTIDKAEAAVNYTAASAKAKNATLDGALKADEALSADDVATYNKVMSASKNANDKLTDDEAAAYNATLEGAVTTSDVETKAKKAKVNGTELELDDKTYNKCSIYTSLTD